MRSTLKGQRSNSLLIRDPNEISSRRKLIQAFCRGALNDRSDGRMECFIVYARTWRRNDHDLGNALDKRLGRWRLMRDMNVAIFVSHAVRKFLAHLLCYFTHIDETVGDVDKLRRGVRSKADDLDAATFVGNGVYCVDKVFIAGNEHRSVVASCEGKHVNRDLDVEIRLARAVIKSLQL